MKITDIRTLPIDRYLFVQVITDTGITPTDARPVMPDVSLWPFRRPRHSARASVGVMPVPAVVWGCVCDGVRPSPGRVLDAVTRLVNVRLRIVKHAPFLIVVGVIG